MINDDGGNWTEIEFPCKPGNVSRSPCCSAPYHHRLDWNIWLIGFKPHQAYLRNRECWLMDLPARILDDRPRCAASRRDANRSARLRECLFRRPWLALLDRETSMHLVDRYYKSQMAPVYAKVDMYRYEWRIRSGEFCSRSTCVEKETWLGGSDVSRKLKYLRSRWIRTTGDFDRHSDDEVATRGREFSPHLDPWSSNRRIRSKNPIGISTLWLPSSVSMTCIH